MFGCIRLRHRDTKGWDLESEKLIYIYIYIYIFEFLEAANRLKS